MGDEYLYLVKELTKNDSCLTCEFDYIWRKCGLPTVALEVNQNMPLCYIHVQRLKMFGIPIIRAIKDGLIAEWEKSAGCSRY